MTARPAQRSRPSANPLRLQVIQGAGRRESAASCESHHPTWISRQSRCPVPPQGSLQGTPACPSGPPTGPLDLTTSSKPERLKACAAGLGPSCRNAACCPPKTLPLDPPWCSTEALDADRRATARVVRARSRTPAAPPAGMWGDRRICCQHSIANILARASACPLHGSGAQRNPCGADLLPIKRC